MKLFNLLGESCVKNVAVVSCFDGFIDAGFAANSAINFLSKNYSIESLYRFDPEDYLSYSEMRPLITIKNGQLKSLKINEIKITLAKDLNSKDFIILSGTEPSLKWKEIRGYLAKIFKDLEVNYFINLGAFPAPVSHLDEPKIAATSPISKLAEEVGFIPGEITFPAGFGNYLENYFGKKLPALTLWARVPHYCLRTIFYPGTIALLNKVSNLTGLAFDTSCLVPKAKKTMEFLEKTVETDEVAGQFLETGTSSTGQYNPFDVVQIPSGDELVTELEKFLKNQGKNN